MIGLGFGLGFGANAMDIKKLNETMRNKLHASGQYGAGCVAAVLDTGTIPFSPLVKQIQNPQGDGFQRFTPHVTGSHGTLVAGAINWWCPKTEILSYSVINQFGVGFNPIDFALKDVIQRAKADKSRRYLVNMSFTMGEVPTTHALIQELVAMGVPVFAAAGNDGSGSADRFPAAWQEPISVASLTSWGERRADSNWHNEIDFCDLGEDVPTIDMDGKPTTFCATSAATPTVLSKAIHLWNQKPIMTEPELFSALKSAAQDMYTTGFDPHTGWGFVRIAPGQAVQTPVVDKPTDEGGNGHMTAKQLVAYFQRAVAEGWGYVWSLNGELYTQTIAEKYHKAKRSTSSHRDPATYWLKDCARWIGKMAADCSGGIVGAMRTLIPSYNDRTANTFYAQCTEKGAIKTIPEIPGLCVWRDGHIGIYEGNGSVLEFRGTEYGAVRTKLSERNFTHWGKLRDIVYGKEESTVAKIIKITNPIVYDADVQALQAALNALGYDCGVVDGKAGDKTLAGIKAFCEAHSAGVTLPDALTLSVEVSGKKYGLDIKAL